jgi:hypothetical protein
MPFLELFARIDAVDCATVMETAKEYIIDKVNLQKWWLFYLRRVLQYLWWTGVKYSGHRSLSSILVLGSTVRESE